MLLRLVVGVAVFFGLGYLCSFVPLMHRVVLFGLTGSMMLSLCGALFAAIKVKS